MFVGWVLYFLNFWVFFWNNIIRKHKHILSNNNHNNNIVQGDGNFAAVYKDSVTSAAGDASIELMGVLITAMIILVSAFE